MRILISIFLFCSVTSMAQPNYVDSLENLLKNNPKPEERIEILSEMMRELIRISPSQAFETGLKLKFIADSIDSDLGRAHYFRLMSALSYVEGNYLYSTSFIFRSIELYSNLKDSTGIANCYLTLSNGYTRQKLYHQAFTYQLKAHRIFTRHNNLRRQGITLTNLSFLSNALGKYDSAILLAKQSILINTEQAQYSVLVNDYKNLGYSFLYMNEYQNALRNFEKSLNLDTQLGGDSNVEAIIEVMLGMSRLYEGLGKKLEAIKWSNSAINKASNTGYFFWLEEGFLQLSMLYKKDGNFKEAYHFLEHYATLVDSLEQKRRIERNTLGDVYLNSLSETQQNELLKREKTLQQKLINQQRVIVIGAIAALGSLGVLVFYLIRSNAKRRRAFSLLSQQRNEIALQKSELEKLNKTKDKFFSIVAHDLRSPLSSLVSFITLIKDHLDQLSKEEIVKMVQQLEQSVNNTIEMTDGLITWAKQQMNRIEYNPEIVLVQDAINEALNVYARAAEQKGIRYEKNLNGNDKVWADKNQVIFIVRNLINNAIKFTKAGGLVSIQSYVENDGVRISIADTGVGMNDNTLNKIFQLGNYTKNKGTAGEPGSGLGLVLCKEFAIQNKGKIWAESIETKGTTFHLFLPSFKGQNL